MSSTLDVPVYSTTDMLVESVIRGLDVFVGELGWFKDELVRCNAEGCIGEGDESDLVRVARLLDQLCAEFRVRGKKDKLNT
jgi:hypothetical protein